METYTLTVAEARKIVRHFPAEETRELIRARIKEAGMGGTLDFTVSPGLEGGRIQFRFACLKAGVKLPRNGTPVE